MSRGDISSDVMGTQPTTFARRHPTATTSRDHRIHTRLVLFSHPGDHQ